MDNSEKCAICDSEKIAIGVVTINPDDEYYFSSHPSVRLMYCPLCGKYINDKRVAQVDLKPLSEKLGDLIAAGER